MKWFLKVLFPTLAGYLAIIVVLKIEEWIHFGFGESNEDLNPIIDQFFYTMLFPMIIILISGVQVLITLPLWNRFKRTKRILGLRGFYFMFIMCIVYGLLFGYTLWERKFGISDLVIGSVFMIIISIAYWTANLWTLYLLEKKMRTNFRG